MQIEKYISITPTPNGALVRFAGQVCLTITEAGQNDPSTGQYFWSVSPIFAKLTYGAHTFMDLPQSYAAHSTMQEAIADGLTRLEALGAFYGVIDLPEDTHATVSEGVDADIEVMLTESFVVRTEPKTRSKPARKMISAFPVLQRAAEMAKEAGEPMHPKFVKLAHKELSAIASEEVEDLDEDQLDELSKTTLGSYAKQSNAVRSHEYDDRKAENRGTGVMRALDKLAGKKAGPLKGKAVTARFSASKGGPTANKDRVSFEKAVDKKTNEDVQLDELSKNTLSSYHSKATKSEYEAEQSNNGDKADKRLAGRNSATARLNNFSKVPAGYKKSVKEELTQYEDVQLDELSKDTLDSYAGKAYKDALNKDAQGQSYSFRGHYDPAYAKFAASGKRKENVKLAKAKSALKEEFMQYEDAIADALASIKEDCRAQALSMTDSLMEAQDLASALFEDIAEEYLAEAIKPLSGDAFWKARDDAHKDEFLKAQRKALGIAEPVKRGRGKPTNIDRDALKTRAHSNVEAGLRPTAGFDRNEKIHFVRHLKDHPDFAEKHVSQAGRPTGTTKVAKQQKDLAKKKQDSAFSMWAGLGKK